MELVKTVKELVTKVTELVSYSDDLRSKTEDLESEIQELQGKISEKALCEDCGKTLYREELESRKIEQSTRGWYRKDVYLWDTKEYNLPYQVEIRTIDIKPFHSDKKEEAREYFESVENNPKNEMYWEKTQQENV